MKEEKGDEIMDRELAKWDRVMGSKKATSIQRTTATLDVLRAMAREARVFPHHERGSTSKPVLYFFNNFENQLKIMERYKELSPDDYEECIFNIMYRDCILKEMELHFYRIIYDRLEDTFPNCCLEDRDLDCGVEILFDRKKERMYLRLVFPNLEKKKKMLILSKEFNYFEKNKDRGLKKFLSEVIRAKEMQEA